MFGKKSVDSITNNLVKMVSDLQALADSNNEKIAFNNEAVSILNADTAALVNEKLRAQKVSKKIEELLSI